MKRPTTVPLLALGIVLAGLIATSVTRCRNDDARGPILRAAAGDAKATAQEQNVEAASAVRRVDNTPAAVDAPTEVGATVHDTGSLRVTVVDADRDDAPVSGLVIVVRELGPGRPRTLRAPTNDEGEVLVEGLTPGRVRIRSGRHLSLAKNADIAAGGLSEVRLAVTGSIRISGIVVDAVGVPVAGADIVILDPTGAWPEVVARARTDGTFAIHPAPRHCNVSARADGFAPSTQRYVMAGAGAQLDGLRLVLPGPGGSLTGTAFDAAGQPVADVVVGLGPIRRGQPILSLPDGTRGSPPPRPETSTGTDGTFRLIGLEPGTHSVIATSRSHPPWTREIEILPHQAASVTIRFVVGGACQGTVRDEDGTPVADASVRAGAPGTPEHRSTQTDGEGRFRLDGLIADRETALRVYDRTRGRAETVVRLRAGETLVWDPHLSRGIVLRGRIEAPDGSSPEHVWVEARASRPDIRWSHNAQAGPDGSFELINCPEGERIDVELKAAGFRPLRREAIDPRAGELLLRLEPHTTKRARIVARLLDPEGQPVADGMIHITGPGGTRLGILDAEGRLDAGNLEPGMLRVRIQAGSWATFDSEAREIAPGETWDLGLVHLRRGGRIELELDRSPGTEGLDVRHSIYCAGRWVETLVGENRPLTSGPLSAGDYVVRIWGPAVALQQIPVTVQEGSTSELRVRVERGVACVLTFEAPTPFEAARIPFKIVQNDQVVFSALASRSEAGLAEFELALMPGRYVARSTFEGLAAATPFTVASSTEPLAVSVPLR